jgi:hypothetical protein
MKALTNAVARLIDEARGENPLVLAAAALPVIVLLLLMPYILR